MRRDRTPPDTFREQVQVLSSRLESQYKYSTSTVHYDSLIRLKDPALRRKFIVQINVKFIKKYQYRFEISPQHEIHGYSSHKSKHSAYQHMQKQIYNPREK